MSVERCVFCGCEFVPEPQAVKVEGDVRVVTQKSCGEEDCDRQRRWAANQLWRKENPTWSWNQKQWMREWSKRHPGRWRRFRAENADYRERERLRMRRKRAERVAKVDGIRHDPVGHLRTIRMMGREGVAKVDGLENRLDEVIDYLEVKARVAKVDGIGAGAGSV